VLLSALLGDSGAHVSRTDYRYALYGAHARATCLSSINAAESQIPPAANLFSRVEPVPGMERSRRLAVLLVMLFLLSFSQSAYSQPTGMTGKSVSGCTCHSNTGTLYPSLNGLPSSGYTPGTSYSLLWDGGPHISGDGGFNLDASAGTWSNLGTNVKIQSGELTHNSDASRSWSADWTAPVAGTGDVHFTLAVLYADGANGNSGDTWGTDAWTVVEASGTGGSAPVASNVTYVPTSPTKGTGLGVSYDYHDADDDSEQGTQIKWFRNGLRVS
ncbi:uncharacterized protein METZ01_LOCUS372717, partial [marine metagenome]